MPSTFGAFLFLLLLVVASGCKDSDPDVDSRRNSIGQLLCVADSVGELARLPKLPSCSADDSSCRDACQAGDAASCLSRAYAVQKKSSDGKEAMLLFHRSCLLGSANGCTNYAAGIWANPHTDVQVACAQRTFEKACKAKEPFACGMVGRLMLESQATSDQIKEGRRYLEAACDELQGFPCRVLAKHLESGKLGDYDQRLIRTLLRRACAGGDRDACGEAKTAAETFH
jgi:hypothetical protein